MAQLAIAAAGAAAGFAIGGPGGAQIGWAVGSMVGAQFGPKQKSYGPRLEDLKVTGSEYGQTIPWAAGHPRIAGQVWWASQRREIGTTTSQGKGGGGAESTSYTYEVDILYGLVNRQILGVSRIWSNGKLIWTALVDSDEDSIINSQNEAPWDRITVHTGGSTQLPDPTYEAAVANAPAYRGRGTVFIEGLQLGNSGVIPNLTFEVVIDGAIAFADKGFLCQWDVMTSGTTVEATLGPDPVLSNGAVLDTGVKKFGASSLKVGHTPNAMARTPSTISQEVHLGKSWRWEFWAYFTDAVSSNAISLGNPPSISIGKSGAFSAYNYNISCQQFFGGGGIGTAGQTPDLNTWTHVAVEQKAGQRMRLYDSKTGFIAEFATGQPVPTFTSSAFARFDVANGTTLYLDSSLFRWFEADEESELYSVGGYSVPTEPFEPPPYAYQTIDPYDDTLQNVVEDLCEAAGMPVGTYDATALASITKPVRAFVLSQVATSRSAIEQLMSAYFFEAYVTDKLYFVPRAGSVLDTIDADDMGAGLEAPDDETLPTQVGSDLEIPAQVSVSYSNVDADYTTATEHSDRLLSGQVSTSVVQLPLGFTSAEGKGIADAIVVDGYASRVTGTFSVPLSYAERTPTDVVAVPDADGNVYRVRIVRRTDEGPLLRFEWVLDDATAIESAGITSEDYTPTVGVALPGETVMEVLDIPLMRDAENTLGHYVAATSSGTTWPGASISRSLDDVEFSEAARVSERGILGVTTTTLGNYTGIGFDERNTVTVRLSYGTLSSSTRAGLLADASVNNIMIGAELVRFRTATFVSDGIYTLSGLLRGQKGTEWAMAGHTSSDVVVLIQTAGMRYVAIDLPSLSAERFYKGVTSGKSLASVSSESFTCEGVSLKPLAPVNVRRTVGTANQITVTWDRRTRLACTFTGASGISVPLGELTEAYEVDVVLIAGSVLKRTLTASSASAIYTAAMQTADGIGASTPIRFDVYQMSAVVGRGYVASLTTVGAVTPLPQITTLTVGGSFASGAALYATLGGVTYNYTSVGGDTNLDGIAASFAAIIDAASAYSAAAVGAVITVTGAVSVPFPVVAGVSAGDNTTTWALTQTASAAVAGVGNQIYFGWKNLSDPGGTNAYPFGMNFNLLVQRIDPPLNLFYTV
ncbi:MAG TPA: phage tail protein, partial [Azonexus sp.]|nr:phage tail protein [Azonexus sp.]